MTLRARPPRLRLFRATFHLDDSYLGSMEQTYDFSAGRMDDTRRLDRGDARRRHHRSFPLGGSRLSVNTVAQWFASEPTPDTSKTISRLSLLTGLVASQLYLIHAAFFAHALTPISVFVIDPKTQLHLISGQLGNIEEVFHGDGLASTMLVSVLVFVLGWMAVRVTAKVLERSSARSRATHTHRYQLAQAAATSDVATASTGAVVLRNN